LPSPCLKSIASVPASSKPPSPRKIPAWSACPLPSCPPSFPEPCPLHHSPKPLQQAPSAPCLVPLPQLHPPHLPLSKASSSPSRPPHPPPSPSRNPLHPPWLRRSSLLGATPHNPLPAPSLQHPSWISPPQPQRWPAHPPRLSA
jgi:hypothetical protein